jgi:BirA family transcriptional regulator, biotin operon repressor / biotin---[acetyl-CoA-carboxylase] ligase
MWPATTDTSRREFKSRPGPLDAQRISVILLRLERMVTWTFIELDDVGSTQAIAKGLASMGAPEGTTVVAKSQSSGEGRLGREWLSPPGGLYMSFVLRPVGLSRPELATLVAAVSVAEGIRQMAGLDATIRWPNDVMLRGKKVSGIIAEAQSQKKEVNQIIIGIGVNCNAQVRDAATINATSLAEELGRRIEVSEVRHLVLGSFSLLYERWLGGEDPLPSWKARISTAGKHVLVKLKTDETPFPCDAKDVDADGNLVVYSEDKSRTVRPEDLEWLREQP